MQSFRPYSPILFRHVFFDMVPPFAINLVFFAFIFLMTRILDVTDMIVNYNVGLFAVAWILVCTLPFFLEFIIPMSVMMGVLMAFLRMSADNEIIALKAAGVSLKRLLPPVLVFCLLGSLLTAFMAVYGLPWGRLSMKRLITEAAVAHFDAALKERTFIDRFDGVVLYVGEIRDRGRTLKDVFIEDRRDEKTVSTAVAPEGELVFDAARMTGRLKLTGGRILRADLNGKSAHTVTFESYEVNLRIDHPGANTGGIKDEEEMSLSELRQAIRSATARDDRYWLTLMEFHKKFSLPFSCFAMGFLAVPLGIGARSGKRAFGVGLGLFFFLLYYLLLSAGWVFGEAGVYPPLIGMWVPNLALGGIGIYLFARCLQERPVMPGFMEAFFAGFRAFRRRLKPKAETGGPAR